jgi:hypothetical protein
MFGGHEIDSVPVYGFLTESEVLRYTELLNAQKNRNVAAVQLCGAFLMKSRSNPDEDFENFAKLPTGGYSTGSAELPPLPSILAEYWAIYVEEQGDSSEEEKKIRTVTPDVGAVHEDTSPNGANLTAVPQPTPS